MCKGTFDTQLLYIKKCSNEFLYSFFLEIPVINLEYKLVLSPNGKT